MVSPFSVQVASTLMAVIAAWMVSRSPQFAQVRITNAVLYPSQPQTGLP